MAWNDIGNNDRQSSSSASDLVQLEGQTRLRLLLPEQGPISNWFYSISTPNGDYRTWLSPEPKDDFFAKNRRIFRVRPMHAGLAYNYGTGRIEILESGNQIWEQIKALVDVGKDLNTRDIMITKTGTGRSTEYKVVDMDPTPFNVDVANAPKPDIQARYATPPTYEQVIEDLRALGFTNPEEIFSTRPITLDEAKQAKVPFGKHKDQTLNDVYLTDSQYILFLATKIDRDDIKQCARVVANHLMGTQYEVTGLAPSMDEVAYVAPAKEGQAQGQQIPPAPPTPEAPPQVYTDPMGNVYHLIDNQWVVQQPAPPVPPVPEPPTDTSTNNPWAGTQFVEQQQEPQIPPVPPVGAPATGFNRQAVIDQINSKFEQDAQYKDFMKIIEVMKKATEPNPKTSINDFTDAEVQKLASLVL